MVSLLPRAPLCDLGLRDGISCLPEHSGILSCARFQISFSRVEHSGPETLWNPFPIWLCLEQRAADLVVAGIDVERILEPILWSREYFRGCAFFVYSGMNRRYTFANPRKDRSCVNVVGGLACLKDFVAASSTSIVPGRTLWP
eukprot:IDg22619t1